MIHHNHTSTTWSNPPGSEDPFVWNDSLRGDYLWSNVNFGEAVSQVMTPLTWSVIQFTLQDWQYIPGFPSVGNIGGYPYLNISTFASVFRALGRSQQDLLDALEATLYLQLPEGMEIPLIPLSGSRRIASLASLVRVQAKQAMGTRAVTTYYQGNLAWFKAITGQIRAAENGAALVAIFHHDIVPHILLGRWCVLGSATHSANYTLKLRRDLETLAGPEDAHLLIANLSDPEGILQSLGPVVGLSRVAGGELSKEAYLEQFGHRGPDEFELSIARPIEDPEWLDRQIELLRQSPVEVAGLIQKQRSAFEGAWQRLQASHPRKARSLGRRIAESARRGRLREAARSAYVRDRWSLRLFALRAAELSDLGQDIFFLTLDEILHLLLGDRGALGFIPSRKATFQQYQSLPPYPSVIRGKFDPFHEKAVGVSIGSATRPVPISTVITGSPGSAGQVEGIVRVLAHPDEGRDLEPGEILCAIQTDIAWTLLFPRVRAVITDVGAPLSHAAIVARELGIPAVVGCGDATRRLKTGDRVRVDGSRGTVRILPPTK